MMLPAAAPPPSPTSLSRRARARVAPRSPADAPVRWGARTGAAFSRAGGGSGRPAPPAPVDAARGLAARPRLWFASHFRLRHWTSLDWHRAHHREPRAFG